MDAGEREKTPLCKYGKVTYSFSSESPMGRVSSPLKLEIIGPPPDIMVVSGCTHTYVPKEEKKRRGERIKAPDLITHMRPILASRGHIFFEAV